MSEKQDGTELYLQPIYDPIPNVKFWCYDPYETLAPGTWKEWTVSHSSATMLLFLTSISVLPADDSYCQLLVRVNGIPVFYDIEQYCVRWVIPASRPFIISPSDLVKVYIYNPNPTDTYYELYVVAYEVME